MGPETSPRSYMLVVEFECILQCLQEHPIEP
jgi:hypothetical protein